MNEREEIISAMAALEAQRSTLGGAAVDAAMEGLRRKLDEFEITHDQKVSDDRNPSWTSERKFVTVLFADISGFTALSDKTDPETMRGYINDCFTDLVPVIERYGGTIEKFIGDEIMAFFGAPIAHENDEERGLLAALEMMERLKEFNSRSGLSFEIHIGVNTGLVVTGNIGTPSQQQYGLIGDTVNLAARLADKAANSQIFVGGETYRMTEPLFEFTALEPIKVQGKANAIQIYNLIKAKDKPGSLRGLGTHGIHSPMVGRDMERATVTASVERVFHGEGGLLVVIAEPGLGKSRLVTEVREQVLSDFDRLNWLEGYALSYGQSISYWPFQVMLRAWVGLTEDDQETENWEKLKNKITFLFDESTIEILPYLANLLAIRVRDEYADRVKYLDGESMGKQVFLASYRLFEQLARQKATVLVFEDLHWADESSAKLLEHLLPLTKIVPLFIIVTSRPDPDSPARRFQNIAATIYQDVYTELRLKPLSDSDSRQLLENLVRIEDLPARFQEMILSKAEGNPFFVEEVIRALIDRGAVKKDPNGLWSVTSQIESIKLPSNIQGIIMTRVDRLNEEVKQILRVAAVIGRSFLYRVLAAISEAEKELDNHLAKLMAVELIDQKQLVPELEYIFRHALVQEVTYESILLQKRRALHSSVGHAIEKLFDEHLDEFYSLLAYHYAKAESWEKALEYLVKAGDQAGRMAADAEALNHYQQAMEIYAHSSGKPWDFVQQAVLMRKIGEAFRRQGNNTRAHEYFIQALVYLGKPFPTSRLRIREEILLEMARQVGHRVVNVYKKQRFVKEISPAVEEEYRITLFMSSIDALQDEELLFYAALRGLNFAEREGNAYGIALGSSGVAMICNFIPVFRLSRYYNNQAIQMAQHTGHPIALGNAHFSIGIEKALQGDFKAAAENSQRAAHYHWEVGNLHQWGLSIETLAQSFIYKGVFDRAVEYAEELIRIGQEGAEEALKCWGWLVLGTAARYKGSIEDAIIYLEKAIQLAESIPDYYSHLYACGELGYCRLQQNQLNSALEILEPSYQVGKKRRIGNSVTPVFNGLLRTYLTVVELSGSAESKIWLQKAGQMCKVAIAQGKNFRGGMPEAMRLRGQYDWLRGKQQAARIWWERSLSEAEEMGMRYEGAMTNLEMGRRFSEPSRIEKAGAVFEEIGVLSHIT